MALLRRALAAVGIAGSYYVQAAMYAFATIWTFQMHVPERPASSTDRPREGFFTSIREGFAYVATNGNVRTQMLIALGPLTFAMSYTSSFVPAYLSSGEYFA